MSYKLHNCGIPEKGQVSGIVKGVYEECAMSVEYNAVYVSKGKMLICGYEIEIDGREVVGIPSDLSLDGLYLVGAISVKDGKATEFRMSLRNTKDLRREDVYGKGYGVYEVLLATVTCVMGVLKIKRELDVLFDETVKFNKSEYCVKDVMGEDILINDAKRGYLKKIKIWGNSKVVGPNFFSRVPSTFRIKAKSRNCFDYQSAKIVREGGVPCANSVTGYKVMGEVQKCENGFRALSRRASPSDFFSNGYLEFDVGYLTAGDYVISCDVEVHETWEENTDCTCFFQVVQGMTDFGYTMRGFSLGKKTAANATYVLSGSGETKIRFYFNGLDVTVSNLQMEKGNTASSYAPYFESTTEINIVDKEGVAHELYSAGNTHDEIVFEDGKYKLIKRIKFAEGKVTSGVKNYSHYLDGNLNEVQVYGDGLEITASDRVGMIAYSAKNPEIIELDQDAIKGLENIEVGPGVLTVCGEIDGLYNVEKPIIYAEYETNPYGEIDALRDEILSLTQRIKALEA